MTFGPNDRRAGILVPLFSMPSTRSWGIGEIGDIERMTAWLAGAGQRLLQLLPITETSPDDPSPYGSLSAMAIDPQYISLADMEDFAAIGGERGLDGRHRKALDRVRSVRAIDYRAVRELKQVALRSAFDHFLRTEWTSGSARASAFRSFALEQAWWLDDYALFRALHARYDERPWTDWPAPVRDREPRVLEAERQALRDEILFRHLPPVGCGRAVGDRALALERRGDLRRPAVHGEWRQCGCVVATGRVRTGGVGRRAS